MKIFISYSAADKLLAEKIRLKLESAGHQAISADSMHVGEHWMQTVSEMLSEADAYIAVISPESKDSKWLLWEWQTALERSWEKPDKMLVGVVVGHIDPPPFLRGRSFIRITSKSKIKLSIDNIIKCIEKTDVDNAHQGIDIISKQEALQRKSELTSEISLFRLSDAELENQRQWLVERISYFSQIAPDSTDIANLKIKLADILKRMGRDFEIVPLLQESVTALERNHDIAAPKIARAQMKLAKALDKIGDHDGAINQICNAIDLCGVESNPDQIKKQLMNFKSNLPEFSEFLSSAIGKASTGAAQRARQFIRSIDSVETDKTDEKFSENTGGGSC